MIIGRTSQRIERRRRVLADDRRDAAASQRVTAGEPSRSSARHARRYTAAAERDQQMRVCDAIPQRRWSILVWCLLAATMVASQGAIEALCQWADRQHLQIDLSPLRLGIDERPGRSSLNEYCLFLTLLLASAYAALILNFRRHRIDDYRGRYRLWYYACGAWFAAALLVGSGLTRTIDSAAAELAEVSRVSADARWLSLGIALLGAAFLVRLVVEMRAARGAVLLLVGSGLIAGVYLGLDTAWLSVYGREFRQWLRAITRLTAAQLLLLSMVVYARHVYLDAQGLRAERVVRPRRRFALRLSFRRKRAEGTGESAGSDAPARKLTVTAPPQPNAPNRAADSARSQPPKVMSKPNAANTQSENARNRDEEPTTYKLSRAERRRQAKERRRAG